jgi:hypothetical protein
MEVNGRIRAQASLLSAVPLGNLLSKMTPGRIPQSPSNTVGLRRRYIYRKLITQAAPIAEFNQLSLFLMKFNTIPNSCF